MDGQPLQMVHFQQTLDQFFALLWNVVVDVFEIAAFYLLEKVDLAFGPEGVVSLQHDVE